MDLEGLGKNSFQKSDDRKSFLSLEAHMQQIGNACDRAAFVTTSKANDTPAPNTSGQSTNVPCAKVQERR